MEATDILLPAETAPVATDFLEVIDDQDGVDNGDGNMMIYLAVAVYFLAVE